MGFLYVRYAVDPNFLWAWVKKYVTDEQGMKIAMRRSQAVFGSDGGNVNWPVCGVVGHGSKLLQYEATSNPLAN